MGQNRNDGYCIITKSQGSYFSEIGFGNENFLKRKEFLEENKIEIIAYRSEISDREIEGVAKFVDNLKEEKEHEGKINNLEGRLSNNKFTLPQGQAIQVT